MCDMQMLNIVCPAYLNVTDLRFKLLASITTSKDKLRLIRNSSDFGKVSIRSNNVDIFCHMPK